MGLDRMERVPNIKGADEIFTVANTLRISHLGQEPFPVAAISNMFHLLFKFGDWELDYFNDL